MADAVPLPQPRPTTLGDTTGSIATPIPVAQSALERLVQSTYGNKCLVASAEVIPDTNTKYFHLYGLTRESFLDLFIQQLIDVGFDPQFATELATGMYGLETGYGGDTSCTKGHCGPLQLDVAYYNEWYVKRLGNAKHPNGYLNPFVQIEAVAYAASVNYNTLLDRFPDGTWHGPLQPFDVYMMHQQGQGGYPNLLSAGPFAIASKVTHNLSDGQKGFGTTYSHNSTVEEFLNAQETYFLNSAARIGAGDCGEFAVRFYAGNN